MAKKPAKISSPLFERFKFEPMRQTQAEAKFSFDEGHNLLLSGYAGTGKTFLACAFALEALRSKQVEQIHIFRSAVPTRDIGFLPGKEDEKIKVYEKALRNIFNQLLCRGDGYEILKNQDLVTFNSTSFERGVTYKKSVLIVDEVQNLTFEEIDTLVTRLHTSSRIILSGDTRQSDLSKSRTGFTKAAKVIEKIPKYFRHHEFGIEDIVRNEMIKAWIIAADDLHNDED